MIKLDKGKQMLSCSGLMKCQLLFPLILLTFNLYGRQDVVANDTLIVNDSLIVEQEEVKTLGFWLAVYLEPPNSGELPGVNIGASAALIYREQFHLGVYNLVYLGDYTDRLIFPNSFNFNYSHAGVWAGYQRKLKDNWRLTADLMAGEGKVFWERTDNFYNMFEDYALFISPAVGVDFRFLRFFALQGAIGYRGVYGLDVPGFDEKALSGPNVRLMLKAGLF